jgi:hypothetical protein
LAGCSVDVTIEVALDGWCDRGDDGVVVRTGQRLNFPDDEKARPISWAAMRPLRSTSSLNRIASSSRLLLPFTAGML